MKGVNDEGLPIYFELYPGKPTVLEDILLIRKAQAMGARIEVLSEDTGPPETEESDDRPPDDEFKKKVSDISKKLDKIAK